MKNLRELLTIAGLLLLVSCGQTGSVTVEDTDCLLNGETAEECGIDVATNADDIDKLEERVEELTLSEQRLLCLEGEFQHCDVVNPFINIAVGDIIRLNEDYGFVVTASIAEGSPNTVLIAQAYGATTFAGTYGVYHRFIISADGDITRKSVEIALPHAAYPGYERANSTIDWSAELVEIDGEWAMEKTNEQIISIDF